jgi:hypothetical protein
METITIINVLAAEAWDDLTPPLLSEGGMLHVIADIEGTGKRAHLVKKFPQGINPNVLQLEIKITNTRTKIEEYQFLSYTELLLKRKQYSEISIHFGKHVLKVIDEIKEVH